MRASSVRRLWTAQSYPIWDFPGFEVDGSLAKCRNHAYALMTNVLVWIDYAGVLADAARLPI
jgi:hypothetical protein